MGSLLKDFDRRTSAGTAMGRIRLEEVTSTNLTLLRDINQKIFPILTVTDMPANQWSQFVNRQKRGTSTTSWPTSGMTTRQRSTSTRSLGLVSRAMTRGTLVFT